MRHRSEKWSDGIEWWLLALHAACGAIGCLAGVLLFVLFTGRAV